MRFFPNLKIKEFKVFKKLNTPWKIQDFIDTLPQNFETKKETVRSPLMVLKHNEAHCIEAALLGAAALWYHGEKPLILDLKGAKEDDDHIIALFKIKNYWGALSKTNHAILRYRDPVYKTIRELVMSYFNEYFLGNGKKTLRSYSDPIDLSKFKTDWLVSEKNLWQIVYALNHAKHRKILEPGMGKILRPVDKPTLRAGELAEWKKKL